MAYDRYERSHWRDDDRFRDREPDRDRDYGRRDERGFFERAGDEIRSWFGDDDDGGRHDRYERSGRRPRERSFISDEGMTFGGERGSGSGDEGWFGSRRHERRHERGDERAYQPMAGDYGRSGFHRHEEHHGRMAGDRDDGRRSNWDRDEYRRTDFAGSTARSSYRDRRYDEERRRHLDEFDRDYDEFCRERQSRFDDDFSSWREHRQGKRRLLGDVREHMEVAGSDGRHVGTVDRVAGDRIILSRSDPESGGVHHSLSCADVDRIEGGRLILACSADDARRRWRDESRERALFEREDQGEAGPHILGRSFSGTYR